MCSAPWLCPALCNPMDCSLPGSSVHGIFQARILEWVLYVGYPYIMGHLYVHNQIFFSHTNLFHVNLILRSTNKDITIKRPEQATLSTGPKARFLAAWVLLISLYCTIYTLCFNHTKIFAISKCFMVLKLLTIPFSLSVTSFHIR